MLKIVDRVLGHDDDDSTNSETISLLSDNVKSNPENGGEKEKKFLSPVGLLLVMFFLVCGGAYGTEDLISSIAPLYAICFILLLPWVWSFPIGLISAELSLAIPSESAFLEWSNVAFGTVISRFESIIVLYVVIIDQAVYPKIFGAYIDEITRDDRLSFWPMYGVYVAFVVVGLFVSLLGTGLIEKTSTLLYIVTLTPFILFALVGFAIDQFNIDIIFETKRHEVESDSALFLSVLVWATAGYEFTGILAQQTKSPSTTYPLVMFLVVFMMIFVYSMPVFISLTTYPDYEYVQEGEYPTIANSLGAGEWLSFVMIAGGLTSSLGTYLSYLHTSAAAISSFTGLKLNYCLILLSISTLCLVPFEFNELIEIETFMYCCHICILCASFIQIRRLRPDLSRPFLIKGGWIGAIVVAILPICVCLPTIVWKDWYIAVIGVASLLLIALCVYIHHRFVEPRVEQLTKAESQMAIAKNVYDDEEEEETEDDPSELEF